MLPTGVANIQRDIVRETKSGYEREQAWSVTGDSSLFTRNSELPMSMYVWACGLYQYKLSDSVYVVARYIHCTYTSTDILYVHTGVLPPSNTLIPHYVLCLSLIRVIVTFAPYV